MPTRRTENLSNSTANDRRRTWRTALRAAFDNPAVELTIGVLILISVVLILAEVFMTGPGQPTEDLSGLIALNQVLAWVFVVELTLRLLVATSFRAYLREFWIDIVAVLPSLFPVFRAARLVRLLRLLRILRLFGFAARFKSRFPYILRRGAIEYAMVCSLLLLTVLLGSATLACFGEMSFADGLWFSIYSLFAGEPIPGPPKSLGGQIVAVGVMFMGLTIFAMFTGTVSAFMVERLRTEGRVVDWEQLSDHVIICGWNSKAEIIAKEYQAALPIGDVPIVVVAQFDGERPALSSKLAARVRFLEGDFTRVATLKQAGILRAQTCIILADDRGGRSEQDADARTILAALTVEKLNADVYTCAELINRSYGTHLQMGHVNDFVVSGEHGAYLLAQAAMNRGLMAVYTELMTHQHGQQLYRLPLPDAWADREFNDVMAELKQRHDAILVAVHSSDGQFHVNPREYRFTGSDDIVVIAETQPRLGGG